MGAFFVYKTVSKPIMTKETTSHSMPRVKPCGSVVTIFSIPSERITAIPVMARIVFTNELIMRAELSPKLMVMASF